MESQSTVPSPPRLWSFSSVRLAIAISLALSLAIEGLMRSNINMAMVCMVNRTAILEEEFKLNNYFDNNTLKIEEKQILKEIQNECKNSFEKENKGSVDYIGGDLIITKQQQSLIFTSFYLGGLIIILPGSFLCDWLGPTQLVFYGALLNVIGTFLTPFIARQMKPMALAFGILVPCVNVLIAHWFPLAEKSTAIAISTTGNQISVIIAMFLTAELCVLEFLGGWASAFYIYDYPINSKRIKHAELCLIQEIDGTFNELKEQKLQRKVNPKEVPWRKILSSLVVWSTGMSSFSQNFMNVGIVVYLPTYYQNVLGMDLTANGLMSALPFVVQLVTKIWFAAVSDWIKRKELMTSTAVTKLFNLIGSFGAGACFVLLSFCDCSTPYLAIVLAITAVGLSSGFIPGYNTSVVCIAPRYTSSIASFSRLLGQIASVASPYMIGLIVVKGTKQEWQFAFWVMAFILISTGLLFQFFGSASIQEWATYPPTVPISRENKDEEPLCECDQSLMEKTEKSENNDNNKNLIEK
uniref:MFS domain-containing protein n=2 Tax=Meloidogyne TaxID=189290 RepID=A0A915P1G5_9BILA